jgi:2,3-dihydroxyphenylpropionate 1,2-dioxygenase
MGQIVAAMATAHAPQFFVYPPTEDFKQLDAGIAAMKEMGKILDETQAETVFIIGSDHLETFFLSAVPTFALMCGKTTDAKFAGHSYAMPTNNAFAAELLDELVSRDFDMVYSQDAELGHAFAAPFEWIIGDRKVNVVCLFVNTYMPPLPTAKRCAALGKVLADVIARRPEKVAIIASGGMSHYPGTWKYADPAFEFDYWMIEEFERGNIDTFLNFTNSQLDEVGNTEMLPWAIMFGAIGAKRGELISYQPTWHHGHGMMRFIPESTQPMPEGKPKHTWNFEANPFEFYRPSDPAVYKLNRILYEMRHDQPLRQKFIKDPVATSRAFGLAENEVQIIPTLLDENIDMLRSLKTHPIVELGAHPLGTLMSLVVVQAEARKMRAEAAKA